MTSEKQTLPLRVLPCSRQDGKTRYHGQEDVEVPSVATFRNNLAALSQYRNLLFVAYVDEIYVYTPSFPEQTITAKPKLVIRLPRYRFGLAGFIDPSRPHAVNHLVVGDLGDEEIVLVACDDGEVISYSVRSISLAIEEGANTVYGLDLCKDAKLRRSGRPNLILPIADWDPDRVSGRLLAPWFHENVGSSAWGLATHKRAFLLAVSSNAHQIAVYAPSLSPERNGVSDWMDPPVNVDDRYEICGTGSSIFLRDRSLGRRVVLRGHKANIPNIAFCDNDLDPEGRYLVSTDIDGYTFVWDIWRGKRIFETNGDYGPGETRARGWGVACLDPRTARLSEASVDTFGCACRVNESDALINNSDAVDLVQDNSEWHPGWTALDSVLPNSVIGPGPQTVVQAPAATTTDQALQIEEEEAEVEADEEMTEINDIDDSSDGDSPDEVGGVDIMAYEAAFHAYINEYISHAAVAASSSSSEDDDSEITDLEEMPLADETEQQAVEEAQENSRTLSPALKKETNRSSDTTHAKTRPRFNLPFNLLQTEGDIHLFRDITFDADPHEVTPGRPQCQVHCRQVHCRQALTQEMPPGYGTLAQLQRLNMIAQIPELGLVVIGNQVGRVGILTMTRWEARKQSGYRIECILPFESEEEKGWRPKRALMGMAVGPVQGMGGPLPGGSPRVGVGVGGSEMRRFRLVMVYGDHTVLSYEISRPEGDEEVVVG